VPNATITFELRSRHGRVTIDYGVNEDPRRWGYDLLGLAFDIDIARGFPVVKARVEFAAEGYAAFLGWVQVVRYWVGAQPEPTIVAPDVAPQMQHAQVPYLSFGIAPMLFDAPAFTERDVVWRASSFLVCSPDALMTAVVEPVCGFTWGYEIREARVEPFALAAAGRTEWMEARAELRAALPEWTFAGDKWEALAFSEEADR
jgi:hypothetical protein